MIYCLSILGLFIPRSFYSQDTANSNKGYIYGYWGYNRSFYTNSDIHFVSDHYDFTLQDIKASDRPVPFSLKEYFTPSSFTVPQYCFRLGYYLTDYLHFSVGMDHMKYVVDQNQKVLIRGTINSLTNSTYNGTFEKQEIDIKKGFLEFEHTNGLNLVSIQADYSFHLAKFHKKKFQLKWNAGLGGIWVGTKADVRILDEGIDNDHHLAGYCMTLQTGPRLEFKKLLFFDIQTKCGYMTLQDIFIENQDAPMRADQEFSFLTFNANFGLMIPSKKRSNSTKGN